MPKTTKRAATKRAEKIARAHASEMTKQEVAEEPKQRRPPGQKAPSRGLARYPWATGIVVILIGLGIYLLYANHIGPFALPKTPPKPSLTAAQQTATPLVSALPAAQRKAIASSPCVGAAILKQITDTSPAPSKDAIAKITHSYPNAPEMTIDTKKVYCAGINTARGLIVIELQPDLAPKTVNNFVFLAEHHFYDGLTFHRVMQTGDGLHIIQGGDPDGNGTGGPGYKFADEPVKSEYTFGTIAMANSGANTNGSQFFINTGDNSKALGKQYNLFGQVVKGLDVALSIQGPGDDAATKGTTPDVMQHVVVVPAS